MDDGFAEARRTVDAAHKIVERQRRVVDQLRKTGCDTTDSTIMLTLFENSLRLFEEHLRDVINEAERARTGLSLRRSEDTDMEPSGSSS
jgi:hypothetical protein